MTIDKISLDDKIMYCRNSFDEYNIKYKKIHSLKAKEELHKIENKEMENNVLPLNIKGNKNELLKDYKKQLKKFRKKSRNKDNKI